MVGWNESYNWMYEDYKRVVNKAFYVENKKNIGLDVEHSSASNIKNLIKWAKEDGYEAEENERLEVVMVKRKEGE